MEGEGYFAHVLLAVILAHLELETLDTYYCFLHTESFLNALKFYKCKMLGRPR